MERSEVVEMVRRNAFILSILIIWHLTINALEFTGNIQESTDLMNDTNLNELINTIAPEADYALLIGFDGTAALITSRSFQMIEIVKQDSVWNSVTEDLPAVCNIRNLKEICIYLKTNGPNKFSKRLNDFEFIGQSSKNGHFVRKYKEILVD